MAEGVTLWVQWSISNGSAELPNMARVSTQKTSARRHAALDAAHRQLDVSRHVRNRRHQLRHGHVALACGGEVTGWYE